MGNEIMSLQTDERALLKQRLPIFFIGLGTVVFVIAMAMADNLVDDSIFSANMGLHMTVLFVAVGIFLMVVPFFWIQHFELVVFEEGFSYVSGKTEASHRFDEVAEMGYGAVTYNGKPNGLERIYVTFSTNAKDVFMPNVDRKGEDGWVAISQALADAYEKHTGNEIIDGVRHIPA